MQVEEKSLEQIIKYLDKTISDQELDELRQWLASSVENFEFFLEIRDIWDLAEVQEFSVEKTEKTLSAFHVSTSKRILNRRPVRRMAGVFLRIAATLLLVVMLSFVFYWIGNKQAGGYAAGNYSEVTVPNGNRTLILLPDGTKVWLNSGTQMKYPVSFSHQSRNIYLDGEAYFEVEKDAKHPFLVETNNLVLEVTGTVFNVMSYAADDIVEATLIEGSLNVMPLATHADDFNEITLKPGEKAVFSKSEHHLTVNLLDEKETAHSGVREEQKQGLNAISELESIVSWKDNKLIFRNETLSEICEKMERWYGISIRMEVDDEKISTIRYNGEFIHNEPVTQVMDILTLTTPGIEYSFDRNVLLIKEIDK